jgi:hypothetical protein
VKRKFFGYFWEMLLIILKQKIKFMWLKRKWCFLNFNLKTFFKFFL